MVKMDAISYVLHSAHSSQSSFGWIHGWAEGYGHALVCHSIFFFYPTTGGRQSRTFRHFTQHGFKVALFEFLATWGQQNNIEISSPYKVVIANLLANIYDIFVSHVSGNLKPNIWFWSSPTSVFLAAKCFTMFTC